MLSSEVELYKTLDSFKDISVLVVGDIILDRYIWGKVERISPEAPVPVVEVRKMEDRLGGAGNVVRNLLTLGIKSSLCGFIGDDEDGRAVLKMLEKDGAGREGVMIDKERPTSVKTRVIAHNQQVVRIDRESKIQPTPALREGFAALVEAQFENYDALIVSDYGKGVISSNLLRRFEEFKRKGKTGVGKKVLFLDPHPANYDQYTAITVAKPNRREAEKASGIKIDSREKAYEAGQILLNKWNAEMMVISLGEDGLAIIEAGKTDGIFLETVAQNVFDVSGAGDSVVAVFCAAMACGAKSVVAGDLANIAGGIAVSEVGTVAVPLAKIKSEIERLAG